MKKLFFLLTAFPLVLSCSSDETSTPVTPPPAPIVKYTITLSAGEGGTVSTTGGEFEAGQTVSVTATPQGEYLFKDWSDGNTNATRTITVNSNITLTANFEKRKYPLTVNFVGEGEVIEEIVNAGRTTEYDSGTTVKLTAQAAAEWVFVGWTGDIESSEESVQIVIGEPKEVTATFEKKKYPLSVNIEGEGEVLEEIVEAGRTTDYDSGTTVKLTAQPEGEWLFTGWSGDIGEIDPTENPIQLSIIESKTVTATFEKKKYPLTVNIEGEGEVLEEIVNAGRTTDYNSGTTVKLTAVPAEGWEFVGWTGAIESTELEVQLLVSEAKEVNAVFSFMPIEGNLFKEDYSYFTENYKVGDIINISGVFMQVKFFNTLQSQGWLDWMNGQYGISVPVGYISLSPLSCYETSLSVELFFNSYNGEFLMARYNNLTNQNENFHFLAKRYYSDTFTPNFNNNAQAKYFDNIDLAFYESGKYTQELRDKGLTPNKIKLIVTEGGKIGLKNLLTSGIEYIYEDKELTFFQCDSFQIIAIPDEGYYHSGWSNNSTDDVLILTTSTNEISGVFKKQSAMNGWFSIFDENRDLSNYPKANLEMDNLLFYFENNVLKNSASVKKVNEYWNLETSEKAIVFEGNIQLGEIGSDFFGYYEGFEERDVIDSIIQLKDNIFSFSILSKNELKSKWKAISFDDFEGSNKMTDYYSEIGFYSDSIYREINPSDIRSYISAFFKDIERYGGVTKFKEEDVKVEFNNYGGWGAFGGGSCGTPTIFFDKHWWETSITSFYDKQNDGMAVIYHELGHAVFGLDHMCESGHIMTGWHGARDGTECRGEKTSESPFGVYSLFLPEKDEDYNFNRAVKDLVTLNKQFPYDCETGTGKGIIMVE